MATHYESSVPWGHVLEHAMWVIALGLLLLASTFFQRELAYPAFFTLFLMVVLLLPAQTAWYCIVATLCHYSPILGPPHFFIFFGLVLIWLIAPMVLAAAVIEPWIRRHSRSDAVQTPNRRAIRVYFVGTMLSLGISVIGGANSHFWTPDTTLKESLFINVAFVLPIALLPMVATVLRRGSVVAWRRFST